MTDSFDINPQPNGLTGAVVLLVDDEPINLKMLYTALEAHGPRLLVAKSGEEALKIAERAKPALILLDVKMPGIDGYETCRRLKSAEATRDATIIFLSALHETREKVKGLALGAVDFITKPFDAEEVLARVTRQLSIQQKQQELQQENRQLSSRLKNVTADEDKNVGIDRVSVKKLIRNGESEQVEFKSTLRWNLKTDKKDKAIETAWLKTLVAFLNTDGGTLLVGVEDDGRVLGTAPDRFENSDKYLLHVNNLIRQHIGLGFAGSIRFDLSPLGDDYVLVVRCRRSRQPVFLKMGQEEAFYVRVGPGSRKLSPSEVVAYVTHKETMR